MKNYTITVNGNVYDVTVEEKGAGAVPALKPAPKAAPAPKAGVGRPSSGEVIGILPQYRKEVIKDIILWKKSRYFIEEKPTSNKALAQWAYSHFDFRTPDYKRLSENTIIQEFGEVWREMKVAGEI